jgi:peptide/nickel transport system ATP-binding protein
MIAMAIACRPRLLIADEPTTALDLTVQAQILDLLREIQAETGVGLLFVTHDLGVVAEIADEVAVMYAGRIVERQSVERLFEQPAHPYTKALLGCLPVLGRRGDRLETIPGRVPPIGERRPGCAFAPRCERAQPVCHAGVPEREALSEGGMVSCFHPLMRG